MTPEPAIRTTCCPWCPTRLPIRIRQSRTGLVTCEAAVVHRCEPVEVEQGVDESQVAA